MSTDDLKSKLERKPFRPFVIELMNDQLKEIVGRAVDQLLESQKLNPAWSKGELWGIERDIIPHARMIIASACEEAYEVGFKMAMNLARPELTELLQIREQLETAKTDTKRLDALGGEIAK